MRERVRMSKSGYVRMVHDLELLRYVLMTLELLRYVLMTLELLRYVLMT